jgi:hypothetical protein
MYVIPPFEKKTAKDKYVSDEFQWLPFITTAKTITKLYRVA